MAGKEQPDARAAMDELLGTAGPSARKLKVGRHTLDPSRVIEILGKILSEKRRARIDQVVAERTYSVATVVEGVVNTGNVSAVMRSSEALGFQSFHVIAGDLPFKHSTRTTQGAQKWLDVHVWKDVDECVESLTRSGHRIVVTHLDKEARSIDEIDFTQNTALVFGNELNGASDRMLELADETCVIPTVGFVQSFNISVAAALALHQVFQCRVRALGRNGDLTETEITKLRADFYYRAADHAENILIRAMESGSTPNPDIS